MNNNILKTGVQNFIKNNSDTDIMAVLLKRPIFEQVTNKELAQQLESRKKCKKKLPTWYNAAKIYYPYKLNIEQTSSEISAQYKAEIISGKSLLDGTGGLGVDSYYFSQKIGSVLHCEINADLSQIADYNFKILSAHNIQTHAENGLIFLKRSVETFDWVYLDPSRRDEIKGKIFKLKDCQPDITEHLDAIFEKSSHIMLKTSPLLDLSLGISELKYVKEIHIISVKNEVKELLWIMEKGFDDEIDIRTINFLNDSSQCFDFRISEEKKAISNFNAPQSYLYEPNVSLLKSGAFRLIGERYSLNKLHTNTHLYTSENCIEFPGRRFRIEKVVPYGKKSIKKLNIDRANITTRNFHEKVSTLRSKFKIKDGGSRYLFFCQTFGEKLIVIICTTV